MSGVTNYTIIGTAPGALAVAAELRLRNRAVTLTARPEDLDSLHALAARRELHVVNEVPSWGEGIGTFCVDGFVYEPELRRALTGADAVIVMVSPNYHEALIAPCAEVLRDDQLMLLCPGGLGGALLISRIAAERSAPRLLVGQASAMPHVAHPVEGGGIRVAGKKQTLPIGVFPAVRTQELLNRLVHDFPQFAGSANVIENGLSSAALGLHPVPMIMNAAQIEQKGPYLFDGYDITPSIARVIEGVDAERQQILRALGGRVYSFADSLIEAYGVKGENLYEVVHNIGSYKQSLSAPDLGYRYLSEDVPTQAVPAAQLARALGIATPLIDALVAFTNAIHGLDHWTDGWNLERLGLAGMDRAAIIEFVRTGQTPTPVAGAHSNGGHA